MLDIVGGIGDLVKVFSCEVGFIGYVVFLDINELMLNVGWDCLIDVGCINVDFVLVNVEIFDLFEDNSFDLFMILFGLCNVIDKDVVFVVMYCVFKLGGCLLVLEFFKFVFELFLKLYDLYLFIVLLIMGKIIVNDLESYKYLVEFICMYLD